MNDSQHILEELKSQRAAHVDLMTKMTDVCGEVRVLVSELRHTQKNYDAINSRMGETEKQLRIIQLENAGNKIIMDIANSMLRRQWMTIMGAIAAVVGSNWTKLF
jgi:hypothetical protein